MAVADLGVIGGWTTFQIRPEAGARSPGLISRYCGLRSSDVRIALISLCMGASIIDLASS